MSTLHIRYVVTRDGQSNAWFAGWRRTLLSRLGLRHPRPILVTSADDALAMEVWECFYARRGLRRLGYAVHPFIAPSPVRPAPATGGAL